ncbi:MAG: WGR domain-containing protein [Candidatus Competibacteraceae bacterium]|nr:WGR domain-containing protein [Candidatus Competibacteraceae bacterium]MBK8755486.1 WGR domain-containing protein [Candidatus Competibacteraceae bacterium]
MRETERVVARWCRQRWEKGTRYYEARLHPNLWGDWMLTVGWGRRGTWLGQIRDRPCASYAEGVTLLAAVGKRRIQRGYRKVSLSLLDMAKF